MVQGAYCFLTACSLIIIVAILVSDCFVQGNEETMDAHSDCETMESEYCSDENEEKENNHESVKFKKVKRKRKRRTKKKSQVCLLNSSSKKLCIKCGTVSIRFLLIVLSRLSIF